MYTGVADIVAILPGLASPNTATTAIITAHIQRADALIDGKCARRYEVPFAATSTSTPPLIKSLSEDITAFYSYRSLFTRDNVNRLEYLDDFYASAMATLQEIQDGKLDLVDTSGNVISETSSDARVYSTTENFTPIFDVDDELSQIIDPDRLESIRTARL